MRKFSQIKCFPYHQSFASFFLNNKIPTHILTTNFDCIIPDINISLKMLLKRAWNVMLMLSSKNQGKWQQWFDKLHISIATDYDVTDVISPTHLIWLVISNPLPPYFHFLIVNIWLSYKIFLYILLNVTFITHFRLTCILNLVQFKSFQIILISMYNTVEFLKPYK